MSHDSDCAVIGRAMTEARKERHAVWHEENTETLNESGLKFSVSNGGESLLFRENRKPKCDFYPSTGRWRVAGVKRTFGGGAAAFIAWYGGQQ